MGGESYAAACAQVALEQKFDGAKEVCETTTDPVRVRWCLACRVYTPALYGQSVAIAGDHVGSPEALMSIAGQRAATSLTDYAFLALVNTAHFHPDAPRNWRTYHDRALVAAASKHDGGTMAANFEKAFYTSAFADHFLQDAFAAGHAGFSRASSSAGASKAFHDIWNNAGRLVKAPTGRCWLQYGDNKWAKTATGRARAPEDSRPVLGLRRAGGVRDRAPRRRARAAAHLFRAHRHHDRHAAAGHAGDRRRRRRRRKPQSTDADQPAVLRPEGEGAGLRQGDGADRRHDQRRRAVRRLQLLGPVHVRPHHRIPGGRRDVQPPAEDPAGLRHRRQPAGRRAARRSRAGSPRAGSPGC